MSEPKVTVKKVMAYKVVMSRGDDVQIDQDEIDNVVLAIQKGTPVRVRRGIFNPSFYVSIVKDEKRVVDFMEDTKYDDRRRARGLEPLKDIFADLPKLGAPRTERPRLDEPPRQLEGGGM